MKRVAFVGLSALLAVGLVAAPASATATAKSSPSVTGAVADCSAGTSCTITWTSPPSLTVFQSNDPDTFAAGSKGVTGTGTVTVSGLDAAKRYYFDLVPDGAKRGLIVADRSLHLESAPNARDIGGYTTADGHHVKWGTVFRSDAISKATDADQAKLANFGIKIVCDFRGESEIQADGADKLPPGAELVSLPILDASNDLSDTVRTAITSKDFAAQEQLLGNGKAAKILTAAGTFLVGSKTARKGYRALLERLTDPASLPALTHCTAGKDRTGWSTAVILTALGVPKKTVMQDYLLTNDYTKEKNANTLKSVSSLMQNPQLLLHCSRCVPSTSTARSTR